MKAIVTIFTVFVIFAGCATSAKVVVVEDPSTVSSYTLTCADGEAELTYSWDVMEVCATEVGGYSVHDIGCTGDKVRVCENSFNYIIMGGENNTQARNCVGPAPDKLEDIKKKHTKCVAEIYFFK